MAFIDWTPALSVSIPAIDQQHQKLVSLINELHDAMRLGKGRDVLGGVLGELLNYTRTHFADEEERMRARGYGELAHHKRLHDELTERVMRLKREFDSGQPVLTIDVMTFLQHWLTNHIMVSDKAYVPNLK